MDRQTDGRLSVCLLQRVSIASYADALAVKISYCWEGADRATLTEKALLHADYCYSRRVNVYFFSVVRSTVGIYSPDGTNM